MPFPRRHALRGRILTFVDDPALASVEAGHRYWSDGLIIIADGIIESVGEAAPLLAGEAAALAVTDYRPHLLTPGFIDAHLHFPQTRVVACYGEQLLDWLNRYVFPEEQKYSGLEYARAAARFFLGELLASGTTTAAVFCSSHASSVTAFFEESARRNTRMIAGKVMMDRNAPPGLLDTAESGYRDSKALIERWHGNGRQLYAISPRFAITSTEAQLAAAGALAREHAGCHVQTHLSENLAEIETVRALFPQARDYLDVYQRFGLAGPRSLFGHCIHLSERELHALHDTGGSAIFCPTSNLFLGSGLFDLKRASDPHRPVQVGVATDIGAGTSYSMLRTMSEAYKILQLQGQRLDPFAAFHMMTRGNARVLSLDDRIGSIAPGREADLVVLDARATPAMAHRMERAETLADELFVLMMMGDERSVRATYVMGGMVQPQA